MVKLIAKPRVRRKRAIRPLTPANVEALRRHMLINPRHGLRDATLVSVLAYAGLRPEEALALEDEHVGEATLLIEQKWVDGQIVPGQKTSRPPRSPPLLNVLRADLQAYQRRCERAGGLIFARADGGPWQDHDWRDWRLRVWQPACEAIGLARITYTTIVRDGKRKLKRTYEGPVPYDLRHSFASLLIHQGEHSLVQIAEWMGNSTATLLSHYAHLMADTKSKSILATERAVRASRVTPQNTSSSRGSGGRYLVMQWSYGQHTDPFEGWRAGAPANSLVSPVRRRGLT